MTQRFLTLLFLVSCTAHASTQASCNATPLTVSAGGVAISSSGYYCLTGDTTGTITINASGVTLDLNNHTITPTTGDGIDVNPTFSNITIQNGNLSLSISGANGITLGGQSGDSNFQIHDVNIDGANNGIQTTGNGGLTNLDIQRVIVTNSSNDGFAISNASNVTISECQAGGNANDNKDGFYIDTNSSDVIINSCVATDNGVAGFQINGQNATVTNCVAQNNYVGFAPYTGSANITLANCAANFNSNSGFDIYGQNVTITNCAAQDNAIGGFLLETTSNNIMLADCTANLNTGAGFKNVNAVAGSVSSFISCVAQNNTVSGFDLSTSSAHGGVGIITSCIAKGNGAGSSPGCGFNDSNTPTNSAYQYVANVAEGNGNNPANSILNTNTDTNYCLGGQGSLFYGIPGDHGPTPYFQFAPATPAEFPIFTPTYWNNVTLP